MKIFKALSIFIFISLFAIGCGSSGSKNDMDDQNTGSNNSGNSTDNENDTGGNSGNDNTTNDQSSIWSIETIECFISSYKVHNTTAVDTFGNVHIAYQRKAGIKYATNASGEWVLRGIDGGFPSSMVIDSLNKAHIVYSSQNKIKHASNSKGYWNDEIIDEDVKMSGETSLTLASTDNLHVIYYEIGGSSKYATNLNGSWNIEELDFRIGPQHDIESDSNGKVHLLYAYNGIGYATKIDNHWEIESLSTTNYSQDISLALNSSDQLHVSYYDGINDDLIYMTNLSGSWITEIIDYAQNTGAHNSMVIDSNDNIHIIYYFSNNSELRHITNKGGTWKIEIIDDKPVANTSITIDSSDNIHIGYYSHSSFSNYCFRYATNK